MFCNRFMLLECTTLLAHRVVITRGLTIQPCVLVLLSEGHICLLLFWCHDPCIDLVWMWTLLFGWWGQVWGISNLVCSKAATFMYTTHGRKFAKHVHSFVLHGQLRIHGGMVLPWEVPFCLPTLVSVKWCVRMQDLRRLVSWWKDGIMPCNSKTHNILKETWYVHSEASC